MRETQKYVVISFHTTTAAFANEKYCKARGIPGRMISVPREMSAGCGIAWRMLPNDFLAYAPETNEKENLHARVSVYTGRPEDFFSTAEGEHFLEAAKRWIAHLEKSGVEVEEVGRIKR